MDWFFAFQPARVGTSPGWRPPSMCAGWGPARVAVVVLTAAPLPTGPRGAWFGVGATEGSKVWKADHWDGTECMSSRTRGSLSVAQVDPLVQRIAGL